MRHPQWKTDTPAADDISGEEESLGDSLRDVQESSLRLSVDGERSSPGESLEHDPAELEKAAVGKSEPELQDQVKRILSKIKKQTPPEHQQLGTDNSKKQNNNLPAGSTTISKYPLLRRRRRLFVIAADCYDSSGATSKTMIRAIQEVFRAVRSDSQMSRISGFALSTAMPISQVVDLLKLARIQPTEFDALVCSSGSAVYYPGTSQCMDAEGKLCADPDYATHIEYRWGYDGVKRTLAKLMNHSQSQQDKDDQSTKSTGIIVEDVKSSNPYCVSFMVKDSTKALRVDDLRQKLRMRGLRCHLMYCRSATRLQVVPLLASRSQALRYLFVRWGLSVANMYVILGERGDTDHEELISGNHKTVIMKGIVEKGSEELQRNAGSYQKEDIVPEESPLIAYTGGGIAAQDIMRALKQASKAFSAM